MTAAVFRVLEALSGATAKSPVWGSRLCDTVGSGPSTVYRLLDRLFQNGWVASWYETAPHPGRPPRKFYMLTPYGRRETKAALAERDRRNARKA